MNIENPSDVRNVSLEGVAERIQMARAAEDLNARQRTAARKAPASSSSPAPPPPPGPSKLSKAELVAEKEAEEYEQRQQILDRVMKYRERFAKLKKRNGTLTIKSSLTELRDEEHYIEQQLGREDGPVGALKPANYFFMATMYGLEQGSTFYNPLKLQLSGLGATTQASIKSFEPLLDEFMIKHSMDMTASVEFRILMMIATTVATVHMANTGQGDLLSKLGPKVVNGDTSDL
jgi:hypothetical protein